MPIGQPCILLALICVVLMYHFRNSESSLTPPMEIVLEITSSRSSFCYPLRRICWVSEGTSTQTGRHWGRCFHCQPICSNISLCKNYFKLSLLRAPLSDHSHKWPVYNAGAILQSSTWFSTTKQQLSGSKKSRRMKHSPSHGLQVSYD